MHTHQMCTHRHTRVSTYNEQGPPEEGGLHASPALAQCVGTLVGMRLR